MIDPLIESDELLDDEEADLDLAIRAACIDAVRHPGQFFIAAWEFTCGWLMGRRWNRILALSIPVVLGAALTSMAAIGRARRGPLLAAYIERINRLELPDPELNTASRPGHGTSSATSTISPVRLSPRDRIVMERLLQLDPSNARARYMVGLQLAARSELGLARHMMRSIAPKGESGFPLAHAWLVHDFLQHPTAVTMADRDVLLLDLETASRASNAPPALLRMYADLLDEAGDTPQAIQVLRRAADLAPVHWLRVAAIAIRNSQVRLRDEALSAFDKWFEQRIGAGTATIADHLGRIESLVLREDWDGAIQAAKETLQRWPHDQLVRRAMSETLRLKYRATSDWQSGKIAIGLLNTALDIDPTNPKVSEEIARLIGRTAELPEAMKSHLQQQLADGTATAVTHLILANGLLQEGEFDKAIPHLEIALRSAPNSPVVMNNLGIALCRRPDRHPEDLTRAADLVEQALAVAGPMAEIYDTLGEIRMAEGRPYDAIDAFESALSGDASRIITRRKLAAAYRAIGLEDMARLHEKLSGDEHSP